MPLEREEIVVPLRAGAVSEVMTCTGIRSTLVSASLLALRERGLSDAYYKHLPPELHMTVQTIVAGSWVPIDLAVAHYRAVDALGLAAAEQVAIGSDVGVRVQASLLGVIFRLAKGGGATPWTALSIYPKLRERIFRGSDTRIVRIGPKDARVENFGIPLVAIPYFRNAWRGMVIAGLGLFCRRVIVTELTSPHPSNTFVYKASWA
ncbi:MAG: hypothetical protein JNL79_25820 [Myxococcales bacterium]|nr:hypothetical protein [Myxococcales bacterium]